MPEKMVFLHIVYTQVCRKGIGQQLGSASFNRHWKLIGHDVEMIRFPFHCLRVKVSSMLLGTVHESNSKNAASRSGIVSLRHRVLKVLDLCVLVCEVDSKVF